MAQPLSTDASPPGSLWLGIYTFPWQLSNLWVWVLMTFGMIILALFACGFSALMTLIYSTDNLIILRACASVFASLVVLTVVTCLYPSAYFLTIVEETAAGNDEVTWPDMVWYEGLRKMAFLLWVFGCCVVVSALVLLPMKVVVSIPGALWWALVPALALLLFPVPLFSAMIAGVPWFLFHPSLLVRLAEKPLAGLSLYVHSLVLMIPCLGLGFWMVLEPYWWLAPIVGVVWSTCFLCYARALGQVGYVLAHDERKAKRKKVKRKRSVHE